MNLLTETGEALLIEDGNGIGLDGFPLNPVARAQESFDFITSIYEPGLTYTQGTKVLTLLSAPVLITNASAQAMGVEVLVSLTDNGVPVEIDGSRRIINPPLVPRSGITENGDTRVLAWNVAAALFEAVLDSIASQPS